MSYTVKFVECSHPSYEMIDRGVKKTFYNRVINIVQVLHFEKEDKLRFDTDKENNSIGNTEKYTIYFRNTETEIRWYFLSKEDRDYNYNKLVSYYSDRISKEEKK